MIVCIAEKPSVAKDIARIIGATTARDGYMEGNGYQVTWTFGHLCELKEPDDYTPMWKHWSLAALPMIPQRFGIKLINDEGIKKQFATIEKLMQAADGIDNEVTRSGDTYPGKSANTSFYFDIYKLSNTAYRPAHLQRY